MGYLVSFPIIIKLNYHENEPLNFEFAYSQTDFNAFYDNSLLLLLHKPDIERDLVQYVCKLSSSH